MVREDLQEPGAVSHLGWPLDIERIDLGDHYLTPLEVPGHTADSMAYLLHNGNGLLLAFVGDTVMPGALGRSDFEQSEHLGYAGSLLKLERVVGPHTLLLPAHDYDGRIACTLSVECAAQPLLAGVLRGRLDAVAFAVAKAKLEQHVPLTAQKTLACGTRVDCASVDTEVELSVSKLSELFGKNPQPILVDVREPYEQRLVSDIAPIPGMKCEQAALSTILNSLPDWLRLPAEVPIVFFCRSGNRSAQVARALRRLGHAQAWSLDGGLALWPEPHQTVSTFALANGKE
jgi:rhodanese-related sulfurtransferase